MGAPSKRARKIRRADEFDTARLERELKKPRDGQLAAYSWTLKDIVAARTQQMIGRFILPARLAESMRTDDALYVAYKNRIAPQRLLPIEIVPGAGARGVSIAAEAEAQFGAGGVAIHPDTIADINGCLANHGVAFGVCYTTPRDCGTRVDYQVKYWPIEYVRWDQNVRWFKARVEPTSIQPGDLSDDPRIGITEYEVPIVHGDGRWIIFQQNESMPFRSGALLPAALVWARHAFAARDWSKGSVAHGNAKVIGEMPAGMALQNADGTLTPEASAFVTLLQAIESADMPAGIRPAGSKTDFLTNNSTAWQVWSELMLNAEKAAARIYLGTDGTLGTQGGAPGVDISQLFGVATTIIRGDVLAIERGLQTGVIEPWTAVNFGDSSLAPRRRYVMPNNDANLVKDEISKRNTAFTAALKNYHDAGITVTPEYIAELAADFGVRAPVLSAPPVVAPPKADSESAA